MECAHLARTEEAHARVVAAYGEIPAQRECQTCGEMFERHEDEQLQRYMRRQFCSYACSHVAKSGDIPLGPFQARYRELLRRGETTATMAIRADFLRGDSGNEGDADVTYFERSLGLRTWQTKHNGKLYGEKRTHATVKQAKRLCRALDVDPVEMGF